MVEPPCSGRLPRPAARPRWARTVSTVLRPTADGNEPRGSLARMHSPRARSRLRLLAVMAVVVVAGLLGRSLPGLVGDIVGGLLYAVLLYLLLALLAPRSRTATLVMAAAALGVTVELVQLTGLPARVGDLWAPAHLVLGSTFVPRDLAVAVAGATLAALTDRLTRRGPARRTVDACHELPDGTTSCRDAHQGTGQPS